MTSHSDENNPFFPGEQAGGSYEKPIGEPATTVPGYVAPPEGEFLGHPSSLWMLFSTEFWERFCYYGMRAMLAVYVADTFFGNLPKESAEEQASLTYGGFTSLVYATGIFGGLIADRFLGYQRSILLGGILMAIGMFMLLFTDLRIFLIGLSVMIAGNGLFKPNISSMVGKLYHPSDARRDSGFTIFYMGINAGAFFAPIVCASMIGVWYGRKYGFLAAAIGMILGIIIFQFRRGMLGAVGLPPKGREGLSPVMIVLAGAIAIVPLIYVLLSQSALLGYVLSAMMIGLIVYFVVSGIQSGEKVQLQRYIAMMVLFVANVLFWALFEQAGSSLNFFARDFVNAPFDFSLFQSFNAFFIIALAPLFAMLWPWLEKRGMNPSIPAKFAIALFSVGLGFYVLVWAIKGTAPDAKVAWTILGLTYLIHTVAELCLSPIGLSMVTKLAKPSDTGMAMGGWFLSTAMANYFAGLIAALASQGGGAAAGHGGEAVRNMDQYATVFTQLWWLGAGFGLLYLIISPIVNKLMHGVK
jgi:POT family proton-dependent oligopeptide transporter